MIEQSILLVINHLLAQEPWARQRVVAHAGKVVELKTADLRLLVQLMDTGSLVAAPAEAQAHATLTIATDMLPHILQHGMQTAAQKVHIAGDAELVAAVGDLLQHLRWDPEQDLSCVLGDIPARRLVQAAQQLNAQTRQSGQRLTENLVEYFTEENAMLLTQTPFAAHRSELQQLRDQIARLEKRVQKLDH